MCNILGSSLEKDEAVIKVTDEKETHPAKFEAGSTYVLFDTEPFNRFRPTGDQSGVKLSRHPPHLSH